MFDSEGSCLGYGICSPASDKHWKFGGDYPAEYYPYIWFLPKRYLQPAIPLGDQAQGDLFINTLKMENSYEVCYGAPI